MKKGVYKLCGSIALGMLLAVAVIILVTVLLGLGSAPSAGSPADPAPGQAARAQRALRHTEEVLREELHHKLQNVESDTAEHDEETESDAECCPLGAEGCHHLPNGQDEEAPSKGHDSRDL